MEDEELRKRLAECAGELEEAIQDPATPKQVVLATNKILIALAAFFDELNHPLGFLSEYRGKDPEVPL